jgi:hypothetical protein
MYFIAAGEVEIELKTAVTRTSLLMLDAHDLHVLMDREPHIAERIHEVARSRLGGDVISPKGDLVAEELEDADTVEPSATARQFVTREVEGVT